MCIKVGITVVVYVGEGYILNAHAARSYNFIPLLSLSFVCLYIAPIVQHRTLTLISIGCVTIDFSNHKALALLLVFFIPVHILQMTILLL